MKEKSSKNYEELCRLQKEHREKRKDLEKKVKNGDTKRMLQDVLNIKEIISIETKQCDILEKQVFMNLNLI